MIWTLVFFGCITSFTVPGLCCRPKEYTTRDGQCCPMCQEGSVVRKDCTAQTGTRCNPCEPGTFMNEPNGLTKCLTCSSCNQGLFAKQDCTTTSDTVCGVLNGYFCTSFVDNAGCGLAVKHKQCESGQGIKEAGTGVADTVCESCQPGYFSQHGVNCTAWTICSAPDVKVKEGTMSRDVVCGSASRHHYFYIPLLLFSLTVVGLVFTVKLTSKKSSA